MSNFLWKKEKKLIRKKSYADRQYLIFLAMLVETKNFFTPYVKKDFEIIWLFIIPLLAYN